MTERILQVHNHGIVGYETHLSPDDHIDVEESETFVTVNIRSSMRPMDMLVTPVNEADGTVGAQVTVTEMVPVEGPGFAPASFGGEGTVTNPEDLVEPPAAVTVEELKGLLRDKGLPVSGTKAELIARLNEAT